MGASSIVTLWRQVAWILPALIGLPASASPEHREPHLRWRGEHPPPLERWFMPGPLGHESGKAPAPTGGRAYLSRSFSGLNNADEVAWMRRNGLGPGPAFSHNLSKVIPRELFSSRPELFPLIDGRRWNPGASGPVNWNPDLGEWNVAVRSAEEAKAFFSENPSVLSFALGVNDGLRFGESDATRRWVYPPRYFRGRPDYSDLVFNFMNRVAEQVAPVHPEKHLGALAYYWCEQLPSFPVHPKVLPFLTADRSQGYDRVCWREERDLKRRWSGAGPERLGIYDYIYGHGFLVPRIHTKLLAEHLSHARRAGFTDYYAELYPNWGLDGPQPWLVAQLLQDPAQSRHRLLDEYYRRFFRDAARPMRRFFEGCEALWMKQPGAAYWLKHYRNPSQVSLYPASAREELREYLEAARTASRNDSVARERVELTSEAFTVTERLAEFVEKQNTLGRAMLNGGEPELALLREAERVARAAFVAKLAEVRVNRPLAFGSVSERDFLRDDWGPAVDRLLAGYSPKQGRELLLDPWWALPGGRDLKIAGLLYEPAMPEGWRAQTEPVEGLISQLKSEAGKLERVLRWENHKTSSFFTVLPVPAEQSAVFSIQVRGRVGISCRVWLTGGWLDAENRVMGEGQAVNLPEGVWNDYVSLWRPLPPRPPNAVALALILRVWHQQPGDWLEFKLPSVRALDWALTPHSE